MDVRNRSNLIVMAAVLVTAGIAVVLWLNGEPGRVVLAPVYVFIVWALFREIDPDHEWSALVAAAFTAVWALVGWPLSSGFAMAGLLLAGRILTSTTGRRPLPVDLSVAAAFGIVIGYTVEGWAAGFGIALAIYLDDRFSKERRLMAVGFAVATAIGTTVVASLAGAFPETAPDINRLMAIVAGVVGLALIARDPAAPISQVDARHAAFIDGVRLHASRSMIGVLVFLMTVLTGGDAEGMVVVIVALGIAVVSNEIELIRRRPL